MTAAWPSDVNQSVLVDGFGDEPDDNLALFSPEVGPPKTRRRMSISTDVLAITLNMTFSEYASFLTFVRTTIKDRSLPFTFTHPRTGSSTTFMMVEKPRASAVMYNLYRVRMGFQTVPT